MNLKIIFKPFGIFFLLSIAVFILVACNNGNSSNVAKAKSNYDVPKEVRENYLNYCAGCHGENLEKFDKSEWMYGADADAATTSIKYGRAS
ncbi:MAG: hypothetical protein KAS71_13955 [Bacteroidales bacterium]|nr:hypothetical protein [Bacteroidales bacterium]